MKGRFALATLVLALVSGSGREPLRAQIQSGPDFEVNALGDSGTGSCDTAGLGDCTLREAIAAANSNVNASTITFAPTLAGQTINLSVIGDSTFGPSALRISTTVTIQGLDGNSGVAIGRNGSVPRLRLFYVTPTGALTLAKLTLINGRAQGFDGAAQPPLSATNGGEGGGGGAAGLGGAIFNQGSLTIQQSTLTGNTAQGGNGGAAGPPGLSSSGSGGGGLNGDGNPGVTDRAGGAGGGGDGGYTFGKTSSATELVVFGRDGAFGGGGGGGSFSCIQPDDTYNQFICWGRTGGNGGFGAGGGGGGGLPSGPTGGTAGFGGGNGANGGGGNGGSGGGGGAGVGGAVFNHRGTVTIVNSTISGNAAQGGNGGNGDASGYGGDGGSGVGGGLFNLNGFVSITNSTFANNTAQGGSGGLAFSGTTPGAASGAGRGGAIYNLAHPAATGILAGDSTLLLQNTILADSTATEDLVNDQQASNAVVQAVTPNIIESAITDIGSGPIFSNGVSYVDPKLAPLALNGGPTATHALLTTPVVSPAIDKGLSSGTSTDQRGWPRPVDISTVSNSNDGADIGAFEFALDADVDGISDEVDEAPLSVSTRFSDRLRGGKTSGRIAVLPAGMTIRIADHPSASSGVRVTVAGATGQRATLRLDGKTSSIQLRSPGSYTVTDPDTETTVGVDVGGPAELQVVVNGTTFVVEIGVGEEAKIIETDSDGNGTVDSVDVEPLIGQITVNGIVVDPGGVTVGSLVNTKLAIQRRLRTFELATTMIPSSAIDPRVEPVNIRVGPFVTTIPAGSFVLRRGVYSYAGTIAGVRLVASIVPQRRGYALTVLGYGPNFTGVVNPVPVQITIGDDSGIQSVRAIIW